MVSYKKLELENNSILSILEPPTVHLSLESEELKQRLSPPPSNEPTVPKKKTDTEDHVIRLPRGTIITVGEEKQVRYQSNRLFIKSIF